MNLASLHPLSVSLEQPTIIAKTSGIVAYQPCSEIEIKKLKIFVGQSAGSDQLILKFISLEHFLVVEFFFLSPSFTGQFTFFEVLLIEGIPKFKCGCTLLTVALVSA